MTRLLVLLVLVLVIAYLLASALERLRRRLGELWSPPQARRRGDRLVPCARCGVHVPRSRALVQGRGGGQRFYCSEGCRRLEARAS